MPVAFTTLIQNVYVSAIVIKKQNVHFKTLCNFSCTNSNKPHRNHTTLKKNKKMTRVANLFYRSAAKTRLQLDMTKGQNKSK